MLDETFIFKGKRAKSKGIELQGSITIGAPVPNFSEYNIPGKNGTLYEYDGTFQNRTITAPCFLLSHLLEKDIDEINAWLLSSPGYHRFEDTNDNRHFMMARAVSGIEKTARNGILIPFTLEFDAMPQRFLKSGEKGINVTETLSIHNPTAFPSLPIISIGGTGDISVEIGGATLTVYGLDGVIDYDAETENASIGNDPLSYNYMIATSDQIKISSGTNEIKVTGDLQSLTIVPRWWEI